MKRSTKIIIGVSIFVYSFIIGICGLFGESIQNALFFFLTKILPYIGIIAGYFFAIFLPIRITQALENNKQRKEEYDKDLEMVTRAQREKELQENILSALTEEDRLWVPKM